MADLDTELMLRVKEGDREAFRQLIERHQGSVIHFCHRSIGDRWEAEDVAQKVFLQMYKSAARYKPTAKFTTWMFTIVRNTTLNELRRRQRHQATSMDALSEETEESPGQQFTDARAESPSEEMQQQELQSKIQEAIQSLPENQRTAITLLRYEEMSYEGIAAVLDCSVSATKSMIHRARETLKEKLQAYLRT
ncbi:MAG: sigma-70 family RNA polymerase sigma factor [Verrucomicrobiae bacterium]|nr:sigma-70 family RNA polymerase sigma factor [Verrucomicrobiae bacterium]